jgi:malate synthase
MGVGTSGDLVVQGPAVPHLDEVLTEDARRFVADLHREFNGRRLELLQRRVARQSELDAGALPDFLEETASVRAGDWSVAPLAPGLEDRRVEITGPVDRKMVINALNCGAKVFMADFEDATSPTWANLIAGQQNLTDAIDRTITFTNPNGKQYSLNDEVATLVVRPRGWHLPEKHVLIDGEPVSGSLFDFGLYFFRNAQRLMDAGSGPYFYLPKLESHLEARLWNDVFVWAQERLGVPVGTIRATVLIETILAAFEMEEILYELREHSSGLNAGRWDYIFSAIKKFRNREGFTLPDRSDVAMAVPFMRAYTELLVDTCHRRGAHAMGGMAAFIPSRKDAAVNKTAIAKVREDKLREATNGFDGTWVAHPDLVAIARDEFDAVLGDSPNQIQQPEARADIPAADLLNLAATPGAVTEAGLRSNISVGIQYLAAWLGGSGAVAIFNLMEDAATAEISRSQVWQWVHSHATLSDGRAVTPDLVRQIMDEELATIRTLYGDAFNEANFQDARQLFERVALDDDFAEFLTLPAYEYLD